jgi:hypothetical protein
MSAASLRATGRGIKTLVAMLGCHFLWWVAVPMLFKAAGAVEKARRSKQAA